MSLQSRCATLALTAAAALSAGGPLNAQPRLPEAGAAPPPRPATAPAAPQGVALSEIARRLEAQGFVVLDLDRERYGFEAEVVARDGRRMELDLDPAGRILREEVDD